MDADTAKQIRERAIQLLARRDYSLRELHSRLCPQFDPGQVEQVLAGLVEQGLQSDTRCAESLVRGRVNQGHGPIRIQGELRQKGIAAAIAQQVLEHVEVDWFQQAQSTFQRKFGLQPANDPKSRAKQIRFLQYRGYTMEQIRFALDSDPAELF